MFFIQFNLQQRLSESSSKFQEYEAIIESILQNLKEWEPQIAEQLDASVVSIENGKQQLDEIKVKSFNLLNNRIIANVKLLQLT